MFRPYRLFLPRSGPLRVLGSLIGVAVLAGVLVFGVVALVGVAVIGGVMWLLRQGQIASLGVNPAAAVPPPPPGVIEGEFVVVRDGVRVPQA